METILSSIKVMLGVEQSLDAFDNELLMHINAAVSELIQGGIGPQEGLLVTSDTTWNEFSDDVKILSGAREYVYCKTRLIWDAPTNSFICDAFNKRADESYWRAYLESDELRRDSNE